MITDFFSGEISYCSRRHSKHLKTFLVVYQFIYLYLLKEEFQCPLIYVKMLEPECPPFICKVKTRQIVFQVFLVIGYIFILKIIDYAPRQTLESKTTLNIILETCIPVCLLFIWHVLIIMCFSHRWLQRRVWFNFSGIMSSSEFGVRRFGSRQWQAITFFLIYNEISGTFNYFYLYSREVSLCVLFIRSRECMHI